MKYLKFFIIQFFTVILYFNTFSYANDFNELIDVGGHRLHIYCNGEGSPTVILEAGFGSELSTWSQVQPEISKFSRVCSYSRAGLGKSDFGVEPRDTNQITKELHALLANQRVSSHSPGPYIFVVHSYGGIHVRNYQHDHPDDVLGMVLVDTTNENEDEFYKMYGYSRGLDQAFGHAIYRSLNSSMPIGAAREQRAFSDSLSILREKQRALPQPLGGRPLSVLRAGISEFQLDDIKENRAQYRELLEPTYRDQFDTFLDFFDEKKAEEAKKLSHAQFLSLSKDSKLRVAFKSGHHIQHDEPELVVDNVKEMISKLRLKKQFLDTYKAIHLGGEETLESEMIKRMLQINMRAKEP